LSRCRRGRGPSPLAVEDEYHLRGNREEQSAETRERFERLIKAEATASAVLAEPTLDALETYMNRAAVLLVGGTAGSVPTTEPTMRAREAEEVAYLELIAALRNQVGTDKLTFETLRRIGEPPKRGQPELTSNMTEGELPG
jgi:hypothetical protein